MKLQEPLSTPNNAASSGVTASSSTSQRNFVYNQQLSSDLGVFDATVFPEVTSTPAPTDATSEKDDDDPFKYQSPVVEICNEVRRKNVAAAAAAWATPLNFAMSSTSTDPWENYQDPLLSTALSEDDIDGSSLCNCNARRNRKRTMSRSSPVRSYSISTPSERSLTTKATAGDGSIINNVERPAVCSICGKKRPAIDRHRFGTVSSKPTTASSSNSPDEDPQHAKHLLEATPQLIVEKDIEVEGLLPQHAKHLLEATPQLRYLSPQSVDMDGGDPSAQESFFSVLLRPDSQPTQDSQPGRAGSGRQNIFGTDHGLPIRDRENQRAAAELANLLWTLAHEMSLEAFGAVESQVFTAVFGLVHEYGNSSSRIAGLVAVHALLSAPSADEEKKSIKFANTLSQALRTAGGDFEFLSLVSGALGRMAQRSSNVDFGRSFLFWMSGCKSSHYLTPATHVLT